MTASLRHRTSPYALFFAPLAAFGCHQDAVVSRATESGGRNSVVDGTRDAFSQPNPLLSESRRRRFFVGNSFFNENWVSAPASVSSRDGLGPLFNARSCSACHFKDGRGRPPEANQPMSSMVLRVSASNAPGPGGAPSGEPVYGEQIQNTGLPGVPAEAEVFVSYTEIPGAFPDGATYSLRKPRYRLENFGYGPPAAPLLASPRVAPALIGLGLLEAVPETALVALHDPNDQNRDGISGRVQRVLDLERGTTVVGRFGWKAEQPSVRQQTASAFVEDMGLTSSLFTKDNCSGNEGLCRAQPNGGTPEIEAGVLDAVTLYARSLAVPVRRDVSNPVVARGEDLFRDIGCSACHAPTLRTEALAGLPESGPDEIHPYSDLLLHDLGPELSDERPTFEAEGREWRTAPLWGIGLTSKVSQHTFFLHDGRARSLTEAIVWHGGEAQAAKKRFVQLVRDERLAVLRFLESL